MSNDPCTRYYAPHAPEAVGGGRLVADDERLDADAEAPVRVEARLVGGDHPCVVVCRCGDERVGWFWPGET